MQSDGVLTCFSNFLFLMYSSNGVVLLAANKVTQRENRAQFMVLKTGRDLESNLFPLKFLNSGFLLMSKITSVVTCVLKSHNRVKNSHLRNDCVIYVVEQKMRTSVMFQFKQCSPQTYFTHRFLTIYSNLYSHKPKLSYQTGLQIDIIIEQLYSRRAFLNKKVIIKIN